MADNLEIHETVVDAVTKAHESVLGLLDQAATKVAEQLPALPLGPADDYLAKGAELADGSLALAEDLLARNRAFVADLFGVAKALLAGFEADEAEAAPATKTAKAA